MKKYNSYKDSGIEWIGEIPRHWEVKKIKYSMLLIMGQSPNSDDCNSDGEGIPFLQGNADFGLINPRPQNWCKSPAKIAPRNSVLLSVRAPIGAVNISDIDYCIGRGLCALISDNTKFTYYTSVCLHDELNSLGTGSTFKAISTEQILNTFIALPPKSEQTAIAAFLDRKTAEIDQLIADKKQLLELYQEEKNAIINKAVTKGINPDAKMKESGIEWLGEIPEHWEVKKLKLLVSKIGSGVTPSGGASVYLTTGIPLLRSQNIHFDGFKLDDVAYISEEINEGMSNSKIQEGDVLLNITGASIGRCFYVPNGFGRGNVNQHVCIIRPIIDIIDTIYLHLLLRSEIGQLQIRYQQTGANREGLNFEQLKNFSLPFPTNIEEQKSIVQFIETKCKKIDSKIARTEKLIKLLTEYRTTLISEVVTGKVMVVDD